MRICYDELKELYKDYKSLKNNSFIILESIYKRQIRYVANLILSGE